MDANTARPLADLLNIFSATEPWRVLHCAQDVADALEQVPPEDTDELPRFIGWSELTEIRPGEDTAPGGWLLIRHSCVTGAHEDLPPLADGEAHRRCVRLASGSW